MQSIWLTPVLAGLLFSQSAPVIEADPKPLAPAQAAIEIDSMRAHMGYLTSDGLRGREAFTPDSLKAAQYLRACLKQAGVAPGWEGEYFQPAPFDRTTESDVPRLVLSEADGTQHVLGYGNQFRPGGRRALASLADLAIVSVDPEGEEAADALQGRAVLFQGSAREWRTWWKDHANDGIALVLRYRSGKKERTPLSKSAPRVVPAWGNSQDEDEVPIVTLYGDFDGWLSNAVSASIESHQSVERIFENNVVGVIPGVGTESNPDLAKQVIVISAHYDHVGIKGDDGTGADRVFNGADDDASGVVVLLELAEALAASEPPARTIVFLLAAAEEKGILGTEYFAEHPPFALEDMACNLNLEMLGRPDDLVGGSGKLWLTGYERSNLGPMFLAAGIPVVEDKRPEMNFFARSDNIVFVRKGVVAQTLSSYNMHSDYHQVSDEMDTIDFDHLAEAARGALAAAKLLADSEDRPSWNEGEPRGFLPK